MRLVFFGSGEFGIPTLETLVARGHEVAAVVTQPDRPAGRGGKTRQTPIRALAEKLGLPSTAPDKPSTAEFAAQLRGLAPELAVVVAYGHLIGRELLDIPRLGFVNLHASLLPAYRGAAPVPWAILNGETVSGASVFSLDERFDTGAVIATAELAIDPEDTAGSYLHRLAPIGAELMAGVVDGLASGRAAAKPQEHARASRAPKLRKEDGAVDWNLPREAIGRKVRAFQPWPQAFTVLPTAKGPLRVNILRLLPADGGGDARPGDIVAADAKSGLVLMAGDGAVRLAELQAEGKRPMSDIEFLRGTRIQQG